MARRPKKWPTYALAALENSQVRLADIRKLSRDAQKAIVDGNELLAVTLLSDIRDKAAEASELLARAHRGDYEEMP